MQPRLHGKRVVVLGGAGFIGSHMCELCLAEGAAAVTVIDNLSTGSKSNLSDPRIRFISHDLCDPLQYSEPVDLIFNFASPASPKDYDRLWLETMRVGSVGTQHGLELARVKNARFLQASTSEVYGDPAFSPQPETYFGNVNPIGPRAVYDEAKRFSESLVVAYRDRLGVDTRIVRIFNTYGPRMRLDDGRVVPAFVGQALKGEALTLYGDGKQTRSFCYVEDEVEGILRLMLSHVKEPVNIGNPHELTIAQFAEAVGKAVGGNIRTTYHPLPKDDPKQRKPDITRARELLKWEPRIPLEEGLQRTVAYFRSVL